MSLHLSNVDGAWPRAPPVVDAGIGGMVTKRCGFGLVEVGPKVHGELDRFAFRI